MLRNVERKVVGWSAIVVCLVASGLGACGSSDSSKHPDGGGVNGGSGGGATSVGGSSTGGAPSGGVAGAGGTGATTSSGGTGARSSGGSSGSSGGGAGRDASIANDASLGSGGANTDAGGPLGLLDAGYVAPGESVLMHHKNPNRDGVYAEPSLSKTAVQSTFDVDSSFKGTLDDPNDQLYAQPLFVDGSATGGKDLVIVATEANNVYALDASTGSVVWKKNLGAPMRSSALPCGNIFPALGVTGTPVIDLESRRIFLDAVVATNEDVAPEAHHRIFALAIGTGAVAPGWPIDVGEVAKSGAARFDAPYQGQRGALAVVGGVLYVPYGGLYGSCQPSDQGAPGDPYRGWVVAVSIADPGKVQAWATVAAAGGVWAPGGIASDGRAVYFSTGNTQHTTVWGGGEAIVRFGLDEALGAAMSYFSPTNWHELDQEDNDFGVAPVLFTLAGATPSELAITFGKDGNAYLLDPANLGGIGAALGAVASSAAPYATAHVATAGIITAPTVYTTAAGTYVALRAPGVGCAGDDLAAYKITPGSPPKLESAWCALGGAGSPIATTSGGAAIVWTLGVYGNQHLNAFDGDTGTALTFPGNKRTLPNLRAYNVAIAAKGRIYVPSDRAVVAFKL